MPTTKCAYNRMVPGTRVRLTGSSWRTNDMFRSIVTISGRDNRGPTFYSNARTSGTPYYVSGESRYGSGWSATIVREEEP